MRAKKIDQINAQITSLINNETIGFAGLCLLILIVAAFPFNKSQAQNQQSYNMGIVCARATTENKPDETRYFVYQPASRTLYVEASNGESEIYPIQYLRASMSKIEIHFRSSVSELININTVTETARRSEKVGFLTREETFEKCVSMPIENPLVIFKWLKEVNL